MIIERIVQQPGKLLDISSENLVIHLSEFIESSIEESHDCTPYGGFKKLNEAKDYVHMTLGNIPLETSKKVLDSISKKYSSLIGEIEKAIKFVHVAEDHWR